MAGNPFSPERLSDHDRPYSYSPAPSTRSRALFLKRALPWPGGKEAPWTIVNVVVIVIVNDRSLHEPVKYWLSHVQDINYRLNQLVQRGQIYF